MGSGVYLIISQSHGEPQMSISFVKIPHNDIHIDSDLNHIFSTIIKYDAKLFSSNEEYFVFVLDNDNDSINFIDDLIFFGDSHCICTNEKFEKYIISCEE